MTDPLAEVMRGLRRDYLAGAPERVAELRALLGALEQGDVAALDALRRAFHKLAGSGGSYGFQAVSTAGRAGEHIAKGVQDRTAGAAVAGADLGALRDSVEAIAKALDAARAAGEELPPATA